MAVLPLEAPILPSADHIKDRPPFEDRAVQDGRAAPVRTFAPSDVRWRASWLDVLRFGPAAWAPAPRGGVSHPAGRLRVLPGHEPDHGRDRGRHGVVSPVVVDVEPVGPEQAPAPVGEQHHVPVPIAVPLQEGMLHRANRRSPERSDRPRGGRRP